MRSKIRKIMDTTLYCYRHNTNINVIQFVVKTDRMLMLSKLKELENLGFFVNLDVVYLEDDIGIRVYLSK